MSPTAWNPNRTKAVIASTLLATATGAGHAADLGCRERAVQILAALDRGDFAAARQDFDARLRANLSEARLREVWTKLPQQLGTLDRRSDAILRHAGDAVIGVVPLHYAMGWFELQVTCSEDGTVDGFWIKPAAQAPSDAAADSFPLPDYAHTDHYHERSAQIGNGALALPATLTLPVGTGPFSAVVLVHGSGAHDADETIGPNKPFRDIALGLASRGIAVLRYMKRAAAHPEAFAAGKDFTVDDETVNDAVLAIQLLRKQPDIDAKKIFVLGHSLGAMMAPRIAERDSMLAGLILLAAPAQPLEDTVVRQVRYLQGANGDEKALAAMQTQRDQIKHLDPTHLPTPPLMLNLPASYWLDLRGYDPVAIAKTLHTPLLILQGGRDYQVTPADDFSHWQRAFPDRPRVTLKEYPLLSHLFMPAGDPPGPKDYQRAAHVDPAVVAEIADWVLQSAAGNP